MRTVLVLGAGQSTPYLIHHLLDHAADLDLEVVVGDRDLAAASARIGDHERGRAIAFDVTSESGRRQSIAGAEVVVNLLPPVFQPLVARACVEAGRPMVSASYRSPEVLALDEEARRRGVLLLCETGLDPGIDLMTARALVEKVHAGGGRVESFVSYGGGLPAPGVETNPLRYCITWNPRNVVMSAEHGAEFLAGGKVKVVPWHRVFAEAWPVEVPGLGTMDAYPNRDSLAYREVLGLGEVATLIRGTLRWPGFCRLWHQIVRLGLPDEQVEIPELAAATFGELTEMFLPANGGKSDPASLEQRVGELLDLAPGSEELAKMAWLGLFSDQVIGGKARRPAEAMVELLRRRLPLPATAADLVVLHHELVVAYPGESRRERVDSTFVHLGEPGGFTAMARTVGLPAAVAARFLLDGTLRVTGSQIPTLPEIYVPLLAELERQGLEVRETARPLTA